MALADRVVGYSLDHPRRITLIMVIVTLALGAMIPWVKVDTDPENMLSEDEAVRVFHHDMKREFTLNDMVVLGVVNEKDPDGVFNPTSLARVYELTKFAEKLRWPDPKAPGKEIGVVEVDLLAPSKVDNIEPAGEGTVRFEWLMPAPPTTREAARAIREKAKANPLLDGTLVSEDGKALCLYLPLTSKDLSYRVYSELRKKIATLTGDEEYHITGLPVAEDTFGVEMFMQMAISAPLAMLVIFILLWLFFRKLTL
ncbi:MAG: RND transporter, partial [Planctomycetes bacterium]|nr:RND transporter [Planctomycetota bacterium]